VVVVNSTETGRPQALLEGSIISARRTAASAALAARTLLDGDDPECIGLVGTGLINHETVRFLAAALPPLRRFVLHDLDRAAAERFAGGLEGLLGGEVEVELAASPEAVLERCSLVAFATTASRPYVDDLSMCPPGAVILHTSLRDLSAAAILRADNVVDDADHVCRAGTSIHLAAEARGQRDFIRTSLARILAGEEPPRCGDDRVTVFSPFGLGVLDLAVADLVLRAARETSRGHAIPDFLHTPFD
jgi:ornithine cyclodeaminase